MIRVLRLIEYEFDDYETMAEHISNLGTPLNGKKKIGSVTIRSAAVDSFEKDTDKPAFVSSLLKYAKHATYCEDAQKNGVVGCTCGLDELKERIEVYKDE